MTLRPSAPTLAALALTFATACGGGASQGLSVLDAPGSNPVTTGSSSAPAGPTTPATSPAATPTTAPYPTPLSPYTGRVVALPGNFTVPGMSDTGPAAADFKASVQAAVADLDAMVGDANFIEHTGDANQSATFSADFALRANDLFDRLSEAASDAIDDASAADANVVASLVSYSNQVITALGQISGVPMTTYGKIVTLSNVIGDTVGMARGTPMSPNASYYEVTWGTGGKAGSNPASGNAMWSAKSFAAGTVASLPALPSGDTGGWVNNRGTNAFGAGATPVVALTAHQGYQGNCSELSGFNAVAVNNPNALVDHVKKVGLSADGLNDLYDITLYVNGAWQTVRIDASMPANNYGANTTDKSQFWMPLYEKAIASLFGTYDAGDFFLVMQFITGSQELYGYSDANQALTDIQAGNAEEAGPSAPEGWYDTQTGAAAAANAKGAFDLIDDHEYAVIGHTATTVTLLNPWNATQDGTGVVTLPNAVFLKLFGQFATLLPPGQVVGPDGTLRPQT